MNSRMRRWSAGRRSDGERTSTTKSGQTGGNFSRWSSVSASQRSRVTQAASGERIAPLGRMKPTEESKASPLPSCSAQLASWLHRSRFLALEAPPAGATRTRTPPASRSMRRSRLSWQKSYNWSSSSVISGGQFDGDGGVPALDAPFGYDYARVKSVRPSHFTTGSFRGSCSGCPCRSSRLRGCRDTRCVCTCEIRRTLTAGTMDTMKKAHRLRKSVQLRPNDPSSRCWWTCKLGRCRRSVLSSQPTLL